MNNFFRFAIDRAILILTELVGLSLLIFYISRVIPGDPARAALGPAASEAQVQLLRHEMYLDRPLYEQYFSWIWGVLHGNLGMSLMTHHQVLDDIVTFLPATLELVTVSMLFAFLVAIPLGAIAAQKLRSPRDSSIRAAMLLGVVMPAFVVGIILQLIFGYYLHIMPVLGSIGQNVTPPPRVTGFLILDSLLDLNPPAFLSAVQHIILPMLALSFNNLGQTALVLRSSMSELGRETFVSAEVSYGLPGFLITYKYMLKNAMIPVLTLFALFYASSLGWAYLVEGVFAWPGMAAYAINAIIFKDFNAIVGTTLVIGVVFVGGNFIVEVLYGLFDPRIRYGVGEEL